MILESIDTLTAIFQSIDKSKIRHFPHIVFHFQLVIRGCCNKTKRGSRTVDKNIVCQVTYRMWETTFHQVELHQRSFMTQIWFEFCLISVCFVAAERAQSRTFIRCRTRITQQNYAFAHSISLVISLRLRSHYNKSDNLWHGFHPLLCHPI